MSKSKSQRKQGQALKRQEADIAKRTSEEGSIPLPRGAQVAVSVSTSFSGPIPHPELLAEYDAVVPGAAEMIVKQWQSQGVHRMRLESRVIHSDIIARWAGLALGFVLCGGAVGGGVYFAHLGHPASGASLACSAIASLAGCFVYGTNRTSKERVEKAKLTSAKK